MKKLVDTVNKLFKDTNFSIVEVGVIAEKLGVDKKEEIHERHFKNMFDELGDEIDKAIPKASEAQLLEALEYIMFAIKRYRSVLGYRELIVRETD